MDGISFSIQNPGTTPANQNVLYLGQPNTLNFLFINSLSINTVSPGDLFVLRIPDGLLQSAAASQFNSANWKVQSLDHQSGLYIFTLTPTQSVDFSNGMTLSFQNLQGQTATNDEVSAACTISGVPIDGGHSKLFVENPPQNGSDNLLDFINIANPPYINVGRQVSSGIVYISPVEAQGGGYLPYPPVANEIRVTLQFTQEGQLVDQWDPGNNIPKFLFSFSYGTLETDLTNAVKSGEPGYDPWTSAWNIQVAIDSGEQLLWQVLPLDTGKATPVWVVEPLSGNPHLFTEQTPDLTLIFSNVMTELAAGGASLGIQWTSIPGFKSDRTELDVLKGNATPGLLNFFSPQQQFQPTDAVELEWDVFAAAQLQLSWALVDSSDPSGKGSFLFDTFNAQAPAALIYTGNNSNGPGYVIPPFASQLRAYSCEMMVPGQPGTSRSLLLTLQPDTAPIIQQFSADWKTDAEGKEIIEFTWLVQTSNVNAYCVLSGVADQVFPLSATGGQAFTTTIYPEKYPFLSTYTLTVKGFTPEVSKSVSLQFSVVKTIATTNVPNGLLVAPDDSKVFMTFDGVNKVGYFDVNALPDALTEFVEFGSNDPDSASTPALTLSVDGKRLFVTSGSSEDALVYYFDLRNPPPVATSHINVGVGNGLMHLTPDGSRAFVFSTTFDIFEGTGQTNIGWFDPQNPPSAADAINLGELELSKIMTLTPDGSRAFVLAVYNIDPNKLTGQVKIAWFDAQHPPATVADFINLPDDLHIDIMSLMIGVGGIFISPDGRHAFFVYAVQAEGSNLPFTWAYFDPNQPPQTLTDFLTSIQQQAAPGLTFSADGQTAFFYFVGVNSIFYAPVSELPGQGVKTVQLANQVMSGLQFNPSVLLVSPRSPWVFVNYAYVDGDEDSNLAIGYFNSAQPPDQVPASQGVNFPQGAFLDSIYLNPPNNLVFALDQSDSMVYYFDAINPPAQASSVAAGTKPVEIAFTSDGKRGFVVNESGGSISVLEGQFAAVAE